MGGSELCSFIPVELSNISTVSVDYYDHQRKQVLLEESWITPVSVWTVDTQNQEWKQKAKVGGRCSPSDEAVEKLDQNWRWGEAKGSERLRGRQVSGRECQERTGYSAAFRGCCLETPDERLAAAGRGLRILSETEDALRTKTSVFRAPLPGPVRSPWLSVLRDRKAGEH